MKKSQIKRIVSAFTPVKTKNRKVRVEGIKQSILFRNKLMILKQVSETPLMKEFIKTGDLMGCLINNFSQEDIEELTSINSEELASDREKFDCKRSTLRLKSTL